MNKKNVLPIAFVHRADFDGMCSAFLLDKYFDGAIEINPVDHGDKEVHSDTAFLDKFDVKGRDVYICDFSFKPSLFKKILDLSNKTVWLDHHVSAIEDIENTSWFQKMLKENDYGKLFGLRNNEDTFPCSGAYLTWAWFFNNQDPGFVTTIVLDENSGKLHQKLVMDYPSSEEYQSMSLQEDFAPQAWIKCPDFIKYISAFDTHCFVGDMNMHTTIIQQNGMKSLGMSFDTPELWRAMLAGIEENDTASFADLQKQQELKEQIEVFGKAVTSYNGLYQYPRINKTAYPIKLEVNGKKFKGLALNVNGFYSDVFEPIYDPEKHDFFLAYYFNGDCWNYSAYVPDDKKEKISAVDIVRSIDEHGGGHKGAAGCRSDKLIKELLND